MSCSWSDQQSALLSSGAARASPSPAAGLLPGSKDYGCILDTPPEPASTSMGGARCLCWALGSGLRTKTSSQTDRQIDILVPWISV